MRWAPFVSYEGMIGLNLIAKQSIRGGNRNQHMYAVRFKALEH